MSSTPKEYTNWALRHRSKTGAFRHKYKNIRDAIYRYLSATGKMLTTKALLELIAIGEITNAENQPYKNGLPPRPASLGWAMKRDDRFNSEKQNNVRKWRV